MLAHQSCLGYGISPATSNERLPETPLDVTMEGLFLQTGACGKVSTCSVPVRVGAQCRTTPTCQFNQGPIRSCTYLLYFFRARKNISADVIMSSANSLLQGYFNLRTQETEEKSNNAIPRMSMKEGGSTSVVAPHGIMIYVTQIYASLSGPVPVEFSAGEDTACINTNNLLRT